MARGYDEPFTLYGLVARSVETDAERSYVTFTLDPAARFSDGKPVTPADVIFSWQLLRDKGRPNHRTYYAKVAKAEAVGERAVRFDLAGSDDRELPLILGLMPVLAKHAVKPETFEETSFAPPLGSGPYTGRRGRSGQERDAQAQPRLLGARPCRSTAASGTSTRSASITIATPMRYLEAFKRGLFDVRIENDPTRWQTGYDFPAVRDGRVVKEALPTGLPKASSYFVFNTRRPVFADIRVREAISLLFDFEWINHSYFFDLYRRTASYFEGSELSAHGRRGRRARARAAGAVPRRGARRRARRHLVAAGQRRLRPRPHDAAARPRPVRGGRLRAARHRAGRAADRPAVHVRDHGGDRATTKRLALAVRPEPQARRHRRRACASVDAVQFEARRSSSSIST